MVGRRFRKAALGGILCLFLALLVRCDGDGPSETIVLNVGGAWIEISTLVEDQCGFDPPLPQTFSSNLTIVPAGDQITFVYHAQGGPDTILAGTWNSRTGNFSLTFNDVEEGVTLAAVVDGRFSSNSNYTSNTTIVISDGVDSCTVRTSEVGQRA